MSVAHPAYLHRFLQELKTRPKRALSQNFLIDHNVVTKIVNSLGLEEGDSVLEIGPGPGALTEQLYQEGISLTLVEKDRDFGAALVRFPKASLFVGDFFDYDLTTLPQGTKVVSNLPYHLTSPILTTLLPEWRRFPRLTLMMQKEVALRLMAKVGSEEYGSLTLFRQFYADIVDYFVVKASCFYPRPKVDSMVVTFTLRSPPLEGEESAFFTLTRAAFSKRRKMIRASLKELYGNSLLPALEKANISQTVRAEELTLQDYLALFSALQQRT